jgi:hypothetical protein
MHRFVHRQLDFTRQRVQRQLPRQALTERNLKWRQEFVDEWFTGADRQLIGTNDEQLDQRSNWRLRVGGERGVTRVKQLFWIDETGCNRLRFSLRGPISCTSVQLTLNTSFHIRLIMMHSICETENGSIASTRVGSAAPTSAYRSREC